MYLRKSNENHIWNNYRSFFEKRNVQIITLLVLLFFNIYPVNFTFLPTYTSRIIAVIGIVFFMYSILKSRYCISFPKGLINLVLIYTIFMLWVFYRTAAFSFQDSTLLINTILLFVQVFVGSLFIAGILLKKQVNFNSMISLLHLAILIQAVFIIVSFLSDEFKSFTIGIIPPTGNIDPLHPFRVRGLTHGSGAGLSAIQSIGLLFNAYLLSNIKSIKQAIFILLSASIILVSIFLTGRTGFLILIPILLFMFFNGVIKKSISKKMIISMLLSPLLFIGVFYLLRMGYQYLAIWSTPWGEDGFDRLIRFVTQEFYRDGKLGSYTLMVLLEEHLFFPNNIKDLWIGDPTTFSLNRVSSDIGYVRRIFGIGIIGASLAYSLYIYMFLLTYRNIKDSSQKLLIFILMAWILVLEFKEPFIYDFRFAAIYTMIMFYTVLSNDDTITFSLKSFMAKLRS